MRPTEFIATLHTGKPGPAYFLLGPDRFLHEECRAAIVHSLPPEARAWCLADIEFEPGHLAHELQNAEQLPMLGGHSYLVFSDTDDFKHAGDEDTEALKTYLEKPSAFSTLVFAAYEPDRRRRFIQLLEKKAEIVEILPLPKREAAAWAREFCHRAGIDLDPELAVAVTEKFAIDKESGREPARDAVNLLWLRTELEKLLTAKTGAKRIESDDLALISTFREEHEIGKLLLALAERRCAAAIAVLRALLASKVAETLVLWCIGDVFRQALKGAGRTSSGGWARRTNPFSSWEIAPLVRENYAHEELLHALRLVRRADLGIKSSWKDSRLLLEILVWQVIVGKGTVAAMPPGDADGAAV